MNDEKQKFQVCNEWRINNKKKKNRKKLINQKDQNAPSIEEAIEERFIIIFVFELRTDRKII